MGIGVPALLVKDDLFQERWELKRSSDSGGKGEGRDLRTEIKRTLGGLDGIFMIIESMKGEGCLKKPWNEEKLNIRIFITNLPDINLKLVLEGGKWEDKSNQKQSFNSSLYLSSIIYAQPWDLGTAGFCLSPPPSFTRRPVTEAGGWEVAIYQLVPSSLLEPRELCSTLCNDMRGERIWRRGGMCGTGSLCCRAEINTTLQTNSVLSCLGVSDSAAPWTAALQVFLSVEFSDISIKDFFKKKFPLNSWLAANEDEWTHMKSWPGLQKLCHLQCVSTVWWVWANMVCGIAWLPSISFLVVGVAISCQDDALGQVFGTNFSSASPSPWEGSGAQAHCILCPWVWKLRSPLGQGESVSHNSRATLVFSPATQPPHCSQRPSADESASF